MRAQGDTNLPATVIRVTDPNVLQRFEEAILSEPDRDVRPLTPLDQVTAAFLEWVDQHGEPLPSVPAAPHYRRRRLRADGGLGSASPAKLTHCFCSSRLSFLPSECYNSRLQ